MCAADAAAGMILVWLEVGCYAKSLAKSLVMERYPLGPPVPATPIAWLAS